MMNKTMTKTLLFPLLAVLATAPVCTRANADGFLGLGWWVVPIAVGGVAIYEIGRSQADDSSQHAVYAPPQHMVYEQQGGYAPQQPVYVQPATVFTREHWYDQPPSYYQQQYGYVAR
jgi:hypothetical protein